MLVCFDFHLESMPLKCAPVKRIVQTCYDIFEGGYVSDRLRYAARPEWDLSLRSLKRSIVQILSQKIVASPRSGCIFFIDLGRVSRVPTDPLTDPLNNEQAGHNCR